MKNKTIENFKMISRGFRFFFLGILVGMSIFAVWCHYRHLLKEDVGLQFFFMLATPILIFVAFLPALLVEILEASKKVKKSIKAEQNDSTGPRSSAP